MTKSRESGENEITDEAKRRAINEGSDICSILAEMIKAAKAERDRERIKKIIKAQKYMGCRNVNKRRQRR
jgi:hypothetical protein